MSFLFGSSELSHLTTLLTFLKIEVGEIVSIKKNNDPNEISISLLIKSKNHPKYTSEVKLGLCKEKENEYVCNSGSNNATPLSKNGEHYSST